jgi:hypothetical protein
MTSLAGDRSACVCLALDAISKAVREMTPVGAKNIPINPVRQNLLARPQKPICRICRYPGHESSNVENASACRAAFMSTVGFWEDMSTHVQLLYVEDEKFAIAVRTSKPTYDMRTDGSPLKGQLFEDIFVNRLTCNYLKFQAHFAGIRPKAEVFLRKSDKERYVAVTQTLNEFILGGLSCE